MLQAKYVVRISWAHNAYIKTFLTQMGSFNNSVDKKEFRLRRY